MCGIAGIVGAVDVHTLTHMTQMLYHRGPDDGAVWIDRRGLAGFGHRRLSIIDTSINGRQPMQTPDGRFTITYNGEIFNFRELRRQLENKGYQFRSQSDTETVLYGFAEWGESLPERLTGQFAFGIWDTTTQRLFLARDHYGIKPLYYYTANGTLYFASEAKAILAVAAETREIEWTRIPQYLAFLWNSNEQTFFRGVRKLAPGTSLIYSDGSLDIRRYFSLAAKARQLVEPAESDTAAALKTRIEAAVESQLISDVPLGLLLSGGLDSTIILHSMKAHHPRAFTASYAKSERAYDVFQDDLEFAKLAGDFYQAQMKNETISIDIGNDLPKALWHLDEPLADPTVLTNLAITGQARQYSTVLLSGMGADEVFAGYPRYAATMFGERMRWMPSIFPNSALAVVRMFRTIAPAKYTRRISYLLEHLHKPFCERFIGYSSYVDIPLLETMIDTSVIPYESVYGIYDHHRSIFSDTEGLPPVKRQLIADLQTFLPCLNLENMDKTSMANSVEIRVPFLDVDLTLYALSLPDSKLLAGFRGKQILREAFADSLPEAILTRKKTGYSPPVRGWINDIMKADINRMLLDPAAKYQQAIKQESIRHILDLHYSRQSDYSLLIWALYTLETWLQTYFEPDNFRFPASFDTLPVITS